MAKINNGKIEMTDGVLIPDKSDNSIFSAWKISFTGAILLLILLPILSPKPYGEILTFLPDGILRTLQVTLLSIIFTVLIGILVGLGRLSRVPFFNKLATIYVEVVRGCTA